MPPQRVKARPVFDPDALKDELDDMWPPKTPTTTPRAATTERVTNPVSAQQSASAPSADPSSEPTSAGEATTTVVMQHRRYRPPEVLLSAEVYDALYQLQIAEKKTRRGLARTMGMIVLDAVETHAERLKSTWTAAQDRVGEGGLFVRPSSAAVPRRRRHAVTPRTVVLSGVNATNGRQLDALVGSWGAGTRSALVEQALRYQFDLT